MASSMPDFYEVRWRVKNAGTRWGDPQRVHPADEVVVEGLDRTVLYEFEVRSASSCGARSVWVPSDYTVPASTAPPDIASVAAQSLADGVHLAWTVGVTAPAGIEYSIERSPDGSTAWAVRNRTRSLAYTDPETSATVYYYRVRAINFDGVAGNYSVVVNSAGVNVSAINTTANTAQSLATQAPVINGGFDATPYGTGWSADAGWTFKSDSAGPGAGVGYAQFNPTGNPAAIYNQGKIGVVQGQTYKAQALIRGVASPDGVAYVRIRWLDATGAQIAYKSGNTIAGNVVEGSFAVDQAPAGAYYAAAMIEVDSCTTGYYQVDNVVGTLMPSSQDEVPDGSAYARMQAGDLTANRLDFSKGLLNKQLGNIPDGGGRYGVHQVDGNGLALVDFSQTGHVNKTLDYMPDTATRFAAVQANADNTGSNTANDTAHVNGSTAAAISDGAGRAQLGLDVSGYLPSGRNSLDLIGDSSTRYAAVLPPTVQSGTYAPGSNLILNPNFALKMSDWTNGGWSPYSLFGEPCALVNPPASATTILMYSNTVGVSASLPVSCSLEMYLNQTLTAGQVTADIQWYTSAGAANGNSLRVMIVAASNGGFVRYILDNQIAPAGTASCAMRIFIEGASSTSAAVFVRRCKIEVGSVATPFNDVATQHGNQLTVAGSGQVFGNQLNAPNSLTLNYGAARTATAVTTDSTGAVSINAFSVNMGGTVVSYNAVSNAVTGLTVGSTYQIYCHDVGGTGGTKTWLAYLGDATGLLTLGDDVVLAGQVTIPSSGTSGGGAPGAGCPDEKAWVLRADPEGVFADNTVRAETIRAGHYLRLTDGRIGLVTYSERKPAHRVRVWDENGESLTCSLTAPLELFAGVGKCVLAPECAGHRVFARTEGSVFGSMMLEAEDAGAGFVQHITCQNACFWTGDKPHYLFSHHNLKP